MKKLSVGNSISILVLIIFFVLTIVLEQFIAPTDRMNMLLVCLRQGSIFALLAVAMNLLNGFTGLFSLGHAGFMLIGATTYALFSMPLAERSIVFTWFSDSYVIRISFPEVLGNLLGGPGMIIGMLISIILAGLVTAAFAFLVGLPVLRMRSDYLAIATLGFAEIIRAIIMWQGLGPVTNAGNPLRSFTRTADLNVTIGGQTFGLITFTLAFLSAVCIFIIFLLVTSSYGRAFKAIREDEIAAEAMGINLFKHKQLSFCISSFFVGVGGALLAIFMGTVAPLQFRAAMTYEFLLIVVLGGIGSITGSIVGAMLFVFASMWWLRGLDSGTFLGLDRITIFGVNLGERVFVSGFRMVVFSVIIMCIVLFFRRGLCGDKELPYYVNKLRELIARKSKPKPEAGGADA
ncbi:MAG: branched-chain amino acid ABC transporter permease [Oscillospiraceae bacterium]|nr:branched-chain amino acid ABC transporter permease [Oscillospiraceae bacterium]